MTNHEAAVVIDKLIKELLDSSVECRKLTGNEILALNKAMTELEKIIPETAIKRKHHKEGFRKINSRKYK